MDALSDDLLLRVLSFLDDPSLLLDRVPLVCKRWRRLSRDPRAWAGACLLVPSYDDDLDCGRTWTDSDSLGSDVDGSDDQLDDDSDAALSDSSDGNRRVDRDPSVLKLADFKEAARLILHAPAFYRIKFNWTQQDAYCERGLTMVMSALRRTRAEVREVAFPDAERDNVGGLHSGLTTTTEDYIDELLNFLRSSKDHLRVLHLERMLNASSLLEEDDWWGEEDETSDAEDEADTISVKVANTLAELHHLEELTLYVDAKPKYQGGFLGHSGLPNLRRLKVMPHYSGYNPANVDGMVELMCALLAGSTQSLRHVDFSHNNFPLREAVKLQLARCSQLRSLACDLGDITVVRHMTHLRTLKLSVNDEESHYPHIHNNINVFNPFPELLDLLRANTDFLRSCTSLHNLRDLIIRVVRSPVFPKKIFGRHKAIVVELFGTLTSAARHVTNLRLHVTDLGELLPEAFVQMVGTMKDLETIDLGGFRADLMPHLIGLKALKKVSGYIYSREQGQKRIDAKSVRDFKARRPDVRCSINAS